MINLRESEVRSYSRSFPICFHRASGSFVFDGEGLDYLDFLSGCGSLNYGHNHHILRKCLLEYIEDCGISLSLDMFSEAKDRFMDAFSRWILEPRDLDYRMQFCGPTGANAVEAAIKLARKVTGRTNVIAFTNGFHGCTLGALALTGNRHHRSNSAPLLGNVTRFAYDAYAPELHDSAGYLDRVLSDPSGGCDAPAAIILETIQGEGGLNAASPAWIRAIAAIARKHGALLIVDDIQAGCGRSGKFFSFEGFGIEPDIVTLAKSLSGYGLPMSLVLLKPEHDLWEPGEHNGTFRGHNLAFVTAAAAIETFWSDDRFETALQGKIALMDRLIGQLAARFDLTPKGRGFMQGVDLGSEALCAEVRRACFEQRLILEACGPRDEVLKVLAPLTISEEDLERGFAIMETSIEQALRNDTHREQRQS